MVFSKMKCVVSRNLTLDPPQCSQEWQITFLPPLPRPPSGVADCLSTLISRLGARISYGKLLEKGFDNGESKRGGFVQLPPFPYTAWSRVTTSLSRLPRMREWTRKGLKRIRKAERRQSELRRKNGVSLLQCTCVICSYALLILFIQLLLKYLRFLKTEGTIFQYVLIWLQTTAIRK